LEVAVTMAVKAAAVPRELLERTKATLGTMATVDSHGDAVQQELVDQAWSARQPAFANRLAKLQAKITSHP
jgi:enoyl-CoA hydratase